LLRAFGSAFTLIPTTALVASMSCWYAFSSTFSTATAAVCLMPAWAETALMASGPQRDECRERGLLKSWAGLRAAMKASSAFAGIDAFRLAVAS
jgi:hypothetical protein